MFKWYTINSVWKSILLVEITRTISIAQVRSNLVPCFSSWLSILRHVDNYNFLWYFLCNTVSFYKFVLAKEKRRHINITISPHDYQYCKVLIYNYDLCWLYSMAKCVVIALILFLVFLWDFIVLGLVLSWWRLKFNWRSSGFREKLVRS